MMPKVQKGDIYQQSNIIDLNASEYQSELVRN